MDDVDLSPMRLLAAILLQIIAHKAHLKKVLMNRSNLLRVAKDLYSTS